MLGMETMATAAVPRQTGSKGGRRRLLGVSFDGTPVSGVIVEFLKVAEVFAAAGYEILLDLGFDIKADKGNFFAPLAPCRASLPSWVRLTRVPGLKEVEGYGPRFVSESIERAADGRSNTCYQERLERIAGRIRDRILAFWERLQIDFLIVENGTLPENVAYTLVLQQAIERYGRRKRLGRFVLWRDHDLMWTSEL